MRSAASRWRRQQIAKPPHGLDDVDVQLLADASDEYFDGIGVAVEILIIEMLDQFGARHYAPGVVHQIRQQAVLARGHLDRIARCGHASGACTKRASPR